VLSSGGNVVGVDIKELRALSTTAHSAAREIVQVQTAAAGIIGGLDGRGWNLGAVQGKWGGVRNTMTKLATELDLQALDLQMRAMWVDSFEHGMFGHVPASMLQDPVHAANGNLVHPEMDLALPTRGGLPLHLQRTYNSRDTAVGVFGRGWTSNLDWRVEDCGAVGAIVRHPSGRRDAFERIEGGAYLSPGGARTRLERLRSGWRLTCANGTQLQFGPSGRVQSLEDRNRNCLTFERDPFNRVVRLLDARGRGLSFTYASERLVSASDNAGRTWNYTYSEFGNLVRTGESNGPATRYAYDKADRLVSITDALDRVTLSNTYDDLGRVVEQRNALGAVSHFAYDDSDSGGVRTTLVDPSGRRVQIQHDARGLITEQINALDQRVIQAYTPSGYRESYTDNAGHTWRYTYTPDGLLTSITDPVGAVSRLVYNATGDLAERSDALGNTWRYEYDDRRNVVQLTSPLGGVHRLEYDVFGLVVRATDPDGVERRFSYDESGQLTALASGEVERRFQYDAAGRRLSSTDSTGAATTWDYDAAGRPAAMHNALGHSVRWKYDAAGQLIEEIGATGSRSTMSYDLAARPTLIVNALGARREFAYDVNGNLSRYVDGAGYASCFSYDDLDRIREVVNPNGGATSFAYDDCGRLSELVDARGAVRQFRYDAAGRLVEEIDASGNHVRVHLDAVGRTVRATNALGSETTYAYDADGRPVSRTDASGSTTQLQWSPAGRLTGVVDAHGHEAHIRYDANGRVERISRVDGSEIQLRYDAVGNLASWTDPTGATMQLRYNALRQLIAQIDPLGRTVEFAYEPRGDVSEVREGELRTRLEYDAMGSLSSVIDALGQTTRYGYDPRGLLNSVTDANGHSRHFVYDGSGRVIESVDSLGQRTRVTHDPNGNVLAVEDAAGGRTLLEYDAANRPIKVEGSDGLRLEAEYDVLGRWTQLRSPLGTQHRAYDALGRVTRAVDVHGGVSEYEFHAGGHPSRFVDPSGTEVQLAFDQAHRLADVHDASAGVLRFGYDARGLPLRTELPTGNRREVTRDARGRVTEVRELSKSGALVNSSAYTYDARNNIISAEDNSVRTEYTYDGLSRLIRVDGPDGKTSFTYDAVGNRVRVTLPDGREVRSTFDAANQLLAVDADGAQTRFAYDARGNLTERIAPDGTLTRYTWDSLDRLIEIDSPESRRTYQYDALGVLASELRDDERRQFAHDTSAGLARLLSVSDGGSSTRFVYGPDRVPAARGDSQTVRTDIRGSVLDPDGAAGGQQYDAWGVPTGNEPSAGPLGFTGEPHDAATGLVYLRARWYDPSTGRLLSRDPLPGTRINPISQNAYVYAHDNPVSVLDPAGRSASNKLALPPGMFPGSWPFGMPPGLGPMLNGQFPDPASIFNSVKSNWNTFSSIMGPTSDALLEAHLRRVEELYELAEHYSKLADRVPDGTIDMFRSFKVILKVAVNPPDDPATYYAELRLLWTRTIGVPSEDVKKGLMSMAQDASEEAKGLTAALPWAEPLSRGLPIAGSLADAIFSGVEKWEETGELPTSRRIAASVVAGGTEAAFSASGAEVGLAACSPADVTGIGVAVDAACGIIGGYGGQAVAKPIVDALTPIIEGNAPTPALPHLGKPDPVTQFIHSLWAPLEHTGLG
jgi:RHS repeat-associated protein